MKGSVYRRCGACRKRVDSDTCCPTGTVSWSYRVDVGTSKKREQRRGSGFKRKKDAETAMAAEVTDRQRGTHIERSTVTLEEFATGTFLPLIDSEVQSGTLAQNTASDYRRCLTNHALPIIGDVPLQTLKPSDLQRCYGELSTRLKPKTISNVARTLHRLLEVAIDDGIIGANPAKRARAPKVERKEPATLTPAELDKLLNHVRDHEPDTLALLLFYTTTGVRRGEAIGLRWDDVDLDAGAATLRQQVTTEDGVTVVKKLKTDRSRRTLPLLPVTVEALRQHRTRQLETRLAAGTTWTDHGLVFPREDGTPMRPKNVNRTVNRAIKNAGVTRVTPHGLRHSAASILLDQGAPIPAVSAILGHSSPAITMTVYAHMLEGSDRRSIDSLGTAIFGQKEAQ